MCDSRNLLSIVLACLCLITGAAAADPAPSWLDGFESRRSELLDHYVSSASSTLYNDLAKLSKGVTPYEFGVYSAANMLNTRHDTADFNLAGLLRLLYRHGDDPNLSAGAKTLVRQALLDFKYWPDEPGIDSMCTWTENHEIMFSSGAYLAGQLFPTEIFTNSGKTGTELMAIHRPRILRWLDLRFRTGFSEWLSNTYYDEDLRGLLALVDLADDPELVQRATMVTDLLLLDMALNSYRGIFGSTHGRAYENSKKWPYSEATSDAEWLMFGMGTLSSSSASATLLALSEHYIMPQAVYEIANDTERAEMVNQQRMGLRIEPGNAGGLGFDIHNLEDGMAWMSLEAYCDPMTFPMFVEMLDAYNWWENSFFSPFKSLRATITFWRSEGILSDMIALFECDVARNVRDEVNIYTYRTPDYMLSSAQSYRPGYGGDQHHIWQATLGGNAVCFTTHPAQYSGDTPNYWTGAGWLPRVAQYKNVALILHDATDEDRVGLYFESTLDFTHAWLPREEFDEVVEQDGWVFARHEDGYLALYSQHPYIWRPDAAGNSNLELVVAGRKNVYICEMGRPETHGTFEQFVEAISDADMICDELQVAYRSPSQGVLVFSWSGNLVHNGTRIELGEYPRYATPYGVAGFPGNAITIDAGGHRLSLDWEEQERDTSTPPMPAAGPAPLCAAVALLAMLAARRIWRCQVVPRSSEPRA